MSQPATKPKVPSALSSFLKKKAAPKPASGSALGGGGGEGGGAAPPELSASELLYAGSSSDWTEITSSPAESDFLFAGGAGAGDNSPGLKNFVKSRVSELVDGDSEESKEQERLRLEAEEIQRKIQDARNRAAVAEEEARRKKEAQSIGLGAAGGGASEVAADKPLTYAEKMRREKESSAKAAGQPSLPSVSGVKGDRVLAEDTKAFPTLGPA
jgi:hypothetical protein